MNPATVTCVSGSPVVGHNWLENLQAWLQGRTRRLCLGLYIHVPFCVDRCRYCDFVTVRYRSEWRAPYLIALHQEIDAWQEVLGPVEVITVYFGGGTPSLLRPAEVTEILSQIRGRWSLAPGAEVTLEATPATLNPRRIEAFLAAGVNRISVGIQALDDRLLHWLGRRHNAAQARAVAGYLQAAGVVWNVDFMVGVPGQTPASRDAIRTFLDQYRPHHVSLYALEVHSETPLGRAVYSGFLSLPEDRRVQALWLVLQRDMTRHGYHFYELSNAARTGFFSKHNLLYWSLRPYLGLGMGAHSCIGPWRWANPVTWYAYRAASLSDRRVEYRDRRERWRERILLGLRLRGGIPLNWLERYHTTDRWRSGLTTAVGLGWVRMRKGRVQATPRGWSRLLRLYDLLDLGPPEAGPP